jgi:hypothetical protein
MRAPIVAAILGAGMLLAACNDTANEGSSVAAADAAHATFLGTDAGDHVSAAVTGDFDGDGIQDVALSATGGDGPAEDRPDAGEVYILFGLDRMQGDVDLGSELPHRTLVYGPHAGSSLGRALSVGDYNADGTDDLGISAPLGIDPATGIDSPGLVYLFAGSTELAGSTVDLAEQAADITIYGSDAGDGAGLSLQSADVDGDGRDDFLVGAHLADGPANERPEAGEAYVITGASLQEQMQLPQDAAATLIGAEAGDHLSEATATGYLDDDGLADAVVASTFAADGDNAESGRTYVLMSPLAGVLDLAVETAHLAIGGAEAGDQMGHSIGLGDTDTSGSIDLWLGSVSADGPDNEEDLAGEAHLFRLNSLDQDDGNPTMTVSDASGLVFGPGPKSRLGRSAAMAQIDGEGGLDLAIAATDVLDRAGEVYVLFDGDEIPDRATDASLVYRGSNPDDILGHEAFGTPSLSAVRIGDREGLLIASPGADGPDETHADRGAVYLIRDFVRE